MSLNPRHRSRVERLKQKDATTEARVHFTENNQNNLLPHPTSPH